MLNESNRRKTLATECYLSVIIGLRLPSAAVKLLDRLRAMNNLIFPTIAISSGDPAGIDPEVALKALNDPEVRDLARRF